MTRLCQNGIQVTIGNIRGTTVAANARPKHNYQVGSVDSPVKRRPPETRAPPRGSNTAGLVALFFGLVAALGGAAACTGHALHATAGCTTKGITLPLAVAIILAVAGLAAHLLPPIHLMRTRHRQRSTVA
jgi:hypothetical protein